MTTLTLTLDDDTQHILEQSARQFGLTEEAFIGQLIHNYANSMTKNSTDPSKKGTSRQLGTLEGKASVTFAPNWAMSDDELLDS
jgi:hypothetical protein